MNEYLPVGMLTNEQELRQLRKRYETLKQTLGANAASSDEFRQITMVFNMIRQRQQQRPQQGQQVPPLAQQKQSSRVYSHPNQQGQQVDSAQVAQVPQVPQGPQSQYGFGQMPYGGQQAQAAQQAARQPQQQPRSATQPQFPQQAKNEDPLGWLNMNFQQDLGVAFDSVDSPRILEQSPHGQPAQQQSAQNPQNRPSQPNAGQAQNPNQSNRWKEEDNFMDWLDPVAYGNGTPGPTSAVTQEFPPHKPSFSQPGRPSQMPSQHPSQPPAPQQQAQAQPPTPVQAQAMAQTPQPPTPVTAQGHAQPKGPQSQLWGAGPVPMFKSPAMGRAPTPVRVPATPKLGQQPLTSGFLTDEELNALKFQTNALQQAQKQRMLYLQKQRQQQIPAQQVNNPQSKKQGMSQQQNIHTPMLPTQTVPASRSKRGSVAAPAKGPQPAKVATPQQPHISTPNIPQGPISTVQMHTPGASIPNQQQANMPGLVSNMGANMQDIQAKIEQEAHQKKIQLQQWAGKQPQHDMMPKRLPEGSANIPAAAYNQLATQGQESRSKSFSVDKPDSPLGIVSGPEDKKIVLKPKSKDFKERFGFSKSKDPSEIISKKISFEEFCNNREDLLTLPSLLPIGVSAQGMKRRRNWEISNTISARRSELEKKTNRTIDEEIELKRLALYKWCRAVRGDLTTTIQYFYSTSIDRSNRVHFARLRRLTLNEAALVEQIYKQQVTQKLESKKLESKNSNEITEAQKTLSSFQRKRVDMKQFHDSVLEYQNNAQKEERKKLERSAKQRLQALRANDEEAYIKLLDQIKDTRITHLLKQTNLFLGSLAQAVRTQQNDTLRKKIQDGTTPQEANESADVKEEVDNEEEREKIDYFEVAHQIKEPITEQPSMLVGGQLKEYQIKGLQWMVSLYNNNLNGILADEMGLGKTIQSIALIAYLYEVKKVKGPFLVLVPLSTLTNWNMEFETWAPSLKRVVYKGPPAARKAQQAIVRSGDFQVLLTTYEYIIKDRPVLSRIKWAHMIIDEGHRMKNSNSKLSSTLTQHYSTRYRLILTGTPLQNNLPELWALLNFVLPKIFNSIKSFDEWFNKPFANAGSNDKIDLSEEETLLIIRRLHKVLRPFLLRRLKKDVEKYLPNKTEKVIKCKMSSLQSVMYQQLLRHNALFFANENRLSNGVKGLNNRIIQLRKLCNHPFVFEEVESAINPSKVTNDLLWRVSGKFELLDRILPKFKATGHRVLIFFQMTQIMDIMEDFLRYRGIQFLRLDGTTRAEDRSELLKLFNDPDSPYFCFLLSTRAGGLGLNLQTADTVIIYDTDWNPHQDLQAQDRAHRIGQTKEVRILRLITENSIEENILERAQGKLKIDGKVIQAGKFDNKSTSEEQEAFLRTLLEAEDNNKDREEDEIDNDMDDEELNGMLARNEEEREIFAEFDRNNALQEISSKPRLFTEQELPEVCTDSYLQRQIEVEQANAYKELASRRERNRKQQINYNDEGELDGPKKKIKMPPPKRADDAPNEESPAPGATPVGVQPVGRVRRQGRPPKVKETLSLEEREHMTRNMLLITDRIKKATAPDGRARIDLFLDFPNKRLYPDYYQIIANPIAVLAIEKRIQGKVYQQIDQFAFDWRLMFANARRYNEEGSFVYEDANALESIFISSFRELYDHEPPQHPQAPQPLRRAQVPQNQAQIVMNPLGNVPQPQQSQQHPLIAQHPVGMPLAESTGFYGAGAIQNPPGSLQNIPPARVPQQVPSQLSHISQPAPRPQGMVGQPQPQAAAPQMPDRVRVIPIPAQPRPQQMIHPQIPSQPQPVIPGVVPGMNHPSSAPSNIPPTNPLEPPKDEIDLDVGMDDAVLGEMLDMGGEIDMGGMPGFDVDSYLVGNESLDNLTNFP